MLELPGFSWFYSVFAVAPVRRGPALEITEQHSYFGAVGSTAGAVVCFSEHTKGGLFLIWSQRIL